ncbi:recombinase family protein [Clostridium omnivorum]|uniref:Recombinase n=1 Tax=Clostridium omnivorum TaxID=1604902 RepID=A0ABQ5N2P1_9CLOT|nr:recombinase family protein [Clostridium sp. E14]GLC29473.1 recombinase [Clostridium sp. E14]
MYKVAIYCRLSDEDRNKKNSTEDSESIQNQKNLLTRYALDKEWDIYSIYSDDDYSGLDGERPEFNRMLKDAENGKFQIILCKSQSRFTRDMELVEKYLHNKFVEWGIRFVTVVDGVDTLDKHNKKSRQINGLINEWYCEDISESIKSVFRMKQHTGKFIGSFACFGYIKDPNDNNKLLLDEEAAEVVRHIFNLYMQGNGTQRIANILNERKIPSPTKYKKIKGLNYINPSAKETYELWNKTTVKRILKNEMYIGNMVQHKRAKMSYKSKKVRSIDKVHWIIFEDAHEAIIDKKAFEEVQRRIASKVRSTGIGKTHIFAGKIRCMDCKSSMNKFNSSEKYSYLRCKLYSVSGKEKLCTSHSVRIDELEDIVSTRIKNHINTLCDMNKLCSQIVLEASKANEIHGIENKIKKLKEDIKSRREAIKSLYLDKIKGNITEKQFKELNDLFYNEEQEFTHLAEELEKRKEEFEGKENRTEGKEELIRKFTNCIGLTHAMVNELIDYIEVGEMDKNTGNREINIFWNF